MTPLLQQFLSEARDFLQGISEKLIQLETAPDDDVMMSELFRLVHTLKGNCGLFDFPEMLRVLHVAEDLMAVVRDGDLDYSQILADRLLEAMDFVSMLLDEIENNGESSPRHAAESATLALGLRQLIATPADLHASQQQAGTEIPAVSEIPSQLPLSEVPEALRMALYRKTWAGNFASNGVANAEPLLWISYTPEPECFFKGEDPFFLVRQVPAIQWQKITVIEEWPVLAELDAYRSNLRIDLISSAPREQIDEHFRYVPEQITLVDLTSMMLVLPVGDANGGPVYEDFVIAALTHLDRDDLVSLARAANSMLELSSPNLWLASALRWLLLLIECEPANYLGLRALVQSLRTFTPPVFSETSVATPHAHISADQAPEMVKPMISETTALIAQEVINAQLMVLGMPDQVNWLPGRLVAVATTLNRCFTSMGKADLLPQLDAALAAALKQSCAAPLLAWLTQNRTVEKNQAVEKIKEKTNEKTTDATVVEILHAEILSEPVSPVSLGVAVLPVANEGDIKFNRRAEDTPAGAKTLKVDQEKIERLMNLIGEMVVAKNALPYLASRAEIVFGVRDLSREIKAQYAVINRIAEEMQGAIMQVRMMPVSFVFQRFPRLVRDISRKLGKEVNLVLEGEDTEADKNIIEALADPLIHIVRNSLDHGFETPEIRRSLGKPAEGKLLIRASQEAGRVIIDISDDGKGIDPGVIKTKAFEKGIIDEATFDRITDSEAVNLVFAAGFSTAEVVSDLSGRGVGMDVVRAAVEQVNGLVTLESKVGQGTRMRLSLPLSIAVTNVMIIESNGQIFGVPMEMVVETVRVPRSAIHSIKNHLTAVLRGRVVPLCSLNELLATDRPQLANDEDELATLVIRMRGEHVGILVDDFHEVADIILKPMGGILGSLSAYTGSALLGDGSVLMVLNLKELI